MKLSKILLSGVVAAAMAVGMMGCAPVDEDDHDMITVKGGDLAIIEYDNTNSKDTIRGFKSLKTKHLDAVALFDFDVENSIFSGAYSGGAGFIFDLIENSDGTYNFSVITIQPVKSEDNVTYQTYVSRYENVSAKDKDGGSNFKDINGVMIGDEGCKASEKEWLKGPNVPYATIQNVKNADGEYKVAVELTVNDEGTYTVKYFNAEDVLESKKGEKDVGQIKAGATSLTVNSNTKEVTVDASWKENRDKKTQSLIGYYTKVNGYASFKATVSLPYINKAGEVVELED